MAKMDDLPCEIVARIAQYAVQALDGRITQAQLVLRLVSKRFASCVTEAAVRDITLNFTFSSESESNLKYLEALTGFIRTTGTSTYVHVVYLFILVSLSPELKTALSAFFTLSIHLRVLVVLYTTSSHPVGTFGAGHFPQLIQLFLCSTNARPILRSLLRSSRPKRLDLVDGSSSGADWPDQNGKEPDTVSCPSVTHLHLHEVTELGLLDELDISPERVDCDTTVDKLYVTQRDAVILKLLSAISKERFSQRLHTVVLGFDDFDEVNVPAYRNLFEICRAKKLSLGKRAKGSPIVWLLTKGKVVTPEMGHQIEGSAGFVLDRA